MSFHCEPTMNHLSSKTLRFVLVFDVANTHLSQLTIPEF